MFQFCLNNEKVSIFVFLDSGLYKIKEAQVLNYSTWEKKQNKVHHSFGASSLGGVFKSTDDR